MIKLRNFLRIGGGFGVLPAFLLVFFPFQAFAANEQSTTVIAGPFSLESAWGGVLNVGGRAEVRTVGVTHEAGTAEGSLVVLPSETLTFSYAPNDPAGVLNGGIFSMNPLRGAWVASLANGSDCSADSSAFLVGSDQYAFKLCGTKPSVSLSSNNNAVMSCTGMICTATGVGSVRITATIVGTPTKMWGEKNSEGWIELASTTLAPATLSWNAQVVSPPTLSFISSGTNPIPNGTGVTLSWTAENVIPTNPCVASGDWSGTKAATGTFSTGNLTARRDYTLTCTGPSGHSISETKTVLVGSTPKPQVTLTAGSTLVPYNTGTTLTWSVANPSDTTECRAQGAWSGIKLFSAVPRSEPTGNLVSDSWFILECSGPGGSQPAAVFVGVVPPLLPPDFRDFSADPDHILYDGSTELSWDVQNADIGCTASSDAAVPFPHWNGAVPASDTRTISNLTKTTIFRLSCQGAGGTVVKDVQVLVEPQNLQPPAIVFFDPDDNPLVYNGRTTLRWKAERADTCEASGDWSGSRDFEDDYDTGNLAVSKSYTLECKNLAGSVQRAVAVTVGDPVSPVVIEYFTVDPSTIPYGGETRARWNVLNAQWCYVDWWQEGVQQPRVNNWKFSGDEVWDDFTSSEMNVLVCGNLLGTASASVNVTVGPPPGPGPGPGPGPLPGPPPPAITFTADIDFVSYNSGTILRWNVTDAVSCASYNDRYLLSWYGSKGVTGQSATGNLRNETEFSLECIGPGGTSTAHVLVRVGNSSLPGPSLSFWADRFSISSGDSTTLRWTASNEPGTTCEAAGDWSGPQALSGLQSTGVLTDSKLYRLTCQNAGGSVSVNVRINVGSPPTTPSLNFTVDSVTALSGEKAMLRWNAQNVTECTASASPADPLWSGSVPLTGGRNTSILPTDGTYEYSLTCTNGLPNGTVSSRVRVFVGSYTPIVPNATLTADAYLVPVNEKPVLRYASDYADRCTLTTENASTPPVPSTPFTMGETTILPDGDSGNGDLLLAQQATLSQIGILRSLSFYVTSADGLLRLGVYDATGPNGGPGNLKAMTGEIVPVENSWNTANVTAPISLNPGTYWLAYFPSSDGLGFVIDWSPTATGRFVESDRTYGALPGVFPALTDSNTSHWSFYANLDTTPTSGNEVALPSLAGIVDPSLLMPIVSTTTYTLRCYDTGYSGSVLSSSSIIAVKVGQLVLCPDRVTPLIPGGTTQFHAWWYEGVEVANCNTVASLVGARDVTEETGPWETDWSADGTVIATTGTKGEVSGIRGGTGTVTVRHRPVGSSVFFSQSQQVFVGLPIDCWRCDRAESRCTGETQWDAVNNPPQCSSDTFSSSSSCRFNCSPWRWQEVAP